MPQMLDEPDDIDRLFARLDRVPLSADLTQRILRALPAPIDNRRRLSQWVAIVTGIALTIASIALGNALDASGTLGLLGQTIGDTSTFWSAPGEFIGAFMESLPWLEVAVSLCIFAVFWYSASTLIQPVAAERDDASIHIVSNR